MYSQTIDSLEKIPVKIFETPMDGSVYVANTIAALIREKCAGQKMCYWTCHRGHPQNTLRRTGENAQGRRPEL